MSAFHISLSNLYKHDLNAISFSILGMLFVFGGLVIIAAYITFLPKLLQVLNNRTLRPVTDERQLENSNEEEILLAIAVAFHLNQNFPEDNERITWKSHGDMESPWLVSGRVHGLSVRKDIHSWRKS